MAAFDRAAGTAAFPFPVLLCDIGGTNVRLAEVDAPGAPVQPVGHAGTEVYPDLAAAIAAQRDHFKTPPRSLIVCAAGPVSGRQVKLTNAHWLIDGPEVAAALDLRQGLLLNDFEAQAIMLPSLTAATTRTIGGARHPDANGAKLVLGPGTGLGVGLLVPWQDHLMPLRTEAGHMDFGAVSPLEKQVWAILQRTQPRITGEWLVSGPGSVRLYHALCDIEGVTPATNDAADITARAFADREGLEARSLRVFWHLVARFAGGVALGLLATGGVVLSGGILKKITEFLDEDAFRQAFVDQPPLGALVEKIPVTLVTDDRCVLDGLAALAARPERFMLDYPNRLWR